MPPDKSIFPHKFSHYDAPGVQAPASACNSSCVIGNPATGFGTCTVGAAASNVEDVIARRISQRLQLDSVKINFSAPGDSSREVGDLISFDFPTENSKVAATSGRGAGHKYYSGKFLITSLRHKITQDEYTMHVEAIKDGYKSAISSGFEAADPVVQIPNPLTGIPQSPSQNITPGGGLGGGNDSFR